MSGTESTVFGLDVLADLELPFLQAPETAPTGRAIDVTVAADAEDSDLGWPAAAELISDQRQDGGEIVFQIEASPQAGYRIWGPTYGTSVLSEDGRRLRGAPGLGGMAEWQRLLVAQSLPFAAVLQGLEVLHAGAVVIDGSAIAFLGQSGAGKTSLALELCRRGADFLADDVLALERVGERLVGHPGTAVAGVAHAEAERLDATGMAGGESLAVNTRERVERITARSEPAPLRALFFLDRRADGPGAPSFEPVGDPRLLLASTFNLVLADPQRLVGLLDACALAARGTVERIVSGPAVGPEELAAAVEQRIGGPA